MWDTFSACKQRNHQKVDTEVYILKENEYYTSQAKSTATNLTRTCDAGTIFHNFYIEIKKNIVWLIVQFREYIITREARRIDDITYMCVATA